MHQIDIKGAYLNGIFTDHEVIYMQQPPGYHVKSKDKLVCRHRKILYGLKQSGHRWYQKLVEIMKTHIGFQQSNVDQAVFFFRHNQKSLVIVLVHVDDCTITSAVLAWLGLKALALAWPEVALASSNTRPGQSHQTWLGLA